MLSPSVVKVVADARGEALYFSRSPIPMVRDGAPPDPRAAAAAAVQGGMSISGKTPDGKFVEIAEIPDHPWYVAVQFHPEFQSKPLAPHPLFADFVRASLENRKARTGEGAAARVGVTLS